MGQEASTPSQQSGAIGGGNIPTHGNDLATAMTSSVSPTARSTNPQEEQQQHESSHSMPTNNPSPKSFSSMFQRSGSNTQRNANGSSAFTPGENGSHHHPSHQYSPQQVPQQQPQQRLPSKLKSKFKKEGSFRASLSQSTQPQQPQQHQYQSRQAGIPDERYHEQQLQSGAAQHQQLQPQNAQGYYHAAQRQQQQQQQQQQQHFAVGPINPTTVRPPLPPQPGNLPGSGPPSTHGPALVGVMYASEGGGGRGDGSRRGGTAGVGKNSGGTIRGPGSGANSGQMSSLSTIQSSGASLEAGMSTLSLEKSTATSSGIASLKTTGLSIGAGAATGGDENDWETKWDEDDESSDEGGADEEDYDDGAVTALSATGSKPLPSATAAAGGSSSLVHQPFRPGMDGGHSSSSPIKRPGGVVAVPVMQQQQQTQLQQQMQMQMLQQQQHAHLKEEDVSVLTKRADQALQQPADGVQWDMAAAVPAGQQTMAEQEKARVEKPCVQMFFPLLRVLGKGSFGKVVLVQKRTGKDRGGLYAMKILRKSHLVKRRQIERTRTERKVLSVVEHPFIMKLHFAFQTVDKLYLVLDYCPGGELFFHLSRYRRFPERVARFYAAELLLAIGHLHKRGIIYRDLKPENVLLDAEGHVKLGDFGLAKDNIQHPCEGASSMCGTPEYMAPEVLSQAGHGFCVDYWGLGMLVYEMMTGLPPWYTTDRSKLFRRLKSAPLEIPSYFSQQSAAYVSELLERNPRRRLGVSGIKTAMAHEYFRTINWRALYERRVESPIRPCEGWRAPDGVSRSNSVVGNNNAASAGLSTTLAGNSHSGTLNTAAGDMHKITNDAIDAATINFDNTFTRMPVNTEDAGNDAAQYSDGEGEGEELHENTFVGFTFDEVQNKSQKHPSAAPGQRNGNASNNPTSLSSSPQAYGSRQN